MNVVFAVCGQLLSGQLVRSVGLRGCPRKSAGWGLCENVELDSSRCLENWRGGRRGAMQGSEECSSRGSGRGGQTRQSSLNTGFLQSTLCFLASAANGQDAGRFSSRRALAIWFKGNPRVDCISQQEYGKENLIPTASRVPQEPSNARYFLRPPRYATSTCLYIH